MTTYENRAEQATAGLDVTAADGVVMVRDGMDTWLCEETEYDAAVEYLEGLRPLPNDDDDGGALAYTALCEHVGGAVASIIGACHGDWRALVARAIEAGLIDDGKAYGL